MLALLLDSAPSESLDNTLPLRQDKQSPSVGERDAARAAGT